MTAFMDIAEMICARRESWGHDNLVKFIQSYRTNLGDWVDHERKRSPLSEYTQTAYISEWATAARKLDRLLRGKLPWSNRFNGVYPVFDGYLKSWKPDSNQGLLDGGHHMAALIGILTIMDMPLHEIMNVATSDKPPRYILARMILERG
jgi:hypothetical protein